MTRLGVFIAFATSLFVVLVAVALSAVLQARRASQTSWSSLLDKLKAVDRERLIRVAQDCDKESWEASELAPFEVSDLIGGMDGLAAMEANCTVLVEMAAYVQRWHPEALLVAEELRLNAREIKWHISRLRGAAEIGKLESEFPTNGQRAAAVYYRMTQTLLELYTAVGLPEAAQLQSVL